MAKLRKNVFVPGFGWAGPAWGDLPDEYLGNVAASLVLEEEPEPVEDVVAEPAPAAMELPPPPAPVEKPAPKPRRRRTS
jgi:hypothetical protein